MYGCLARCPALLDDTPAISTTAADRKTLPELGERAVDKLKQLSLMTLAATSPRLAYSDVQAELDLGSVAAVEDLVINCVDAGLMEARLSQVSGRCGPGRRARRPPFPPA